MCHPTYALHSCGHKGQYLAFKQCAHSADTRALVARARVSRVSNLELRLNINARLCKEDRRERYEASEAACARCRGARGAAGAGKGAEVVAGGDGSAVAGGGDSSAAAETEGGSVAVGEARRRKRRRAMGRSVSEIFDADHLVWERDAGVLNLG